MVLTKKQPEEIESKNKSTKLSKGPENTRVTIKYDVGFTNFLTIRGSGANLSWDKGVPLKNIKKDEWVWENTMPFSQCEFKILLNDKEYELGDNHVIQSGSTILYTPRFH